MDQPTRAGAISQHHDQGTVVRTSLQETGRTQIASWKDATMCSEALPIQMQCLAGPSLPNELPPVRTSLRTHFDNIISRFDQLFVVLDDDHGIASRQQ